MVVHKDCPGRRIIVQAPAIRIHLLYHSDELHIGLWTNGGRRHNDFSSEDEYSTINSAAYRRYQISAVHASRVTPLGTVAVADRGDFAGI